MGLKTFRETPPGGTNTIDITEEASETRCMRKKSDDVCDVGSLCEAFGARRTDDSSHGFDLKRYSSDSHSLENAEGKTFATTNAYGGGHRHGMKEIH